MKSCNLNFITKVSNRKQKENETKTKVEPEVNMKNSN